MAKSMASWIHFTNRSDKGDMKFSGRNRGRHGADQQKRSSQGSAASCKGAQRHELLPLVRGGRGGWHGAFIPCQPCQSSNSFEQPLYNPTLSTRLPLQTSSEIALAT